MYALNQSNIKCDYELEATEKLLHCKKLNLWRTREITSNNAICFHTNDYLGLAKHPHIINAFQSALTNFGVGSKSSPLLGGYTTLHQTLEKTLADFLGYPKVLLFSTGYMANLAVVSTLKKQLNINNIISDRLNHASINEAILLSRAKFRRFQHQNEDHVTQLLDQNKKNKTLCITEGVFGVDGDIANLPMLVHLTQKYESLLLMDDAHGFGVLGKQGRGTLEYYDLSHKDVPIMMGTFGKALGTFGAFVASSENFIELLIQYAKPYIFSTAMPSALVASTLESLDLVQKEFWRRHYLQELIEYFSEKVKHHSLPLTPSKTPIQLIFTKDPITTLKCYEFLKQKGFWVGALRPPTVPKNLCRLRINLSVSHTKQDINKLIKCMQWLTPYL